MPLSGKRITVNLYFVSAFDMIFGRDSYQNLLVVVTA